MNDILISPEVIAEVKVGIAPILIGALCSIWSVGVLISGHPLTDDPSSLFGANTLQAWYYCQHYPGDRRALKTLASVY